MTDSKVRSLARAISIAGHPAIMVPGAILTVSVRRSLSWEALTPLGVVLIVAVGLMFWSRRQVRQAKWAHIDASAPAERKNLNSVALLVLGAAALLAASAHAMRLGVGLASGAVVLALAIASGTRFKLSQHVAFATLATFIATYAGIQFAFATGVLTLAIAWSRLELRRHTVGELVAGACAGTLAGTLLIVGLSRLG